MPRTKNVPRRSEACDVREQPHAATTLAAAHAPAPHPDPPPLGAGASGVTLKLEEEDGPRHHGAAPGYARVPVPAPGPRAAFVLVGWTSGDDMDGDGGDDGEEGEEGPGGAGGLELLAVAAHVKEEGAPGLAATPLAATDHRVSPLQEQGSSKRRRDDVAARNDDAPPPKRKSGHRGSKVGKSGLYGVRELTAKQLRQDTPWLKWGARLCVPGEQTLDLGRFSTADAAARAYDAEVRRREW